MDFTIKGPITFGFRSAEEARHRLGRPQTATHVSISGASADFRCGRCGAPTHHNGHRPAPPTQSSSPSQRQPLNLIAEVRLQTEAGLEVSVWTRTSDDAGHAMG